MEVHAWTAIALLAAKLLGAFFDLATGSIPLGAKLDSRSDALGSEMQAQFDAQRDRIESMGARLTLGSMPYPRAWIAFAARVEEQERSSVIGSISLRSSWTTSDGMRVKEVG